MASGCSAGEQAACLDLLRSRELSGGGFAEAAGGVFRPDSTAWAILALEAGGADARQLEPSRRKLAERQSEDGRVCLSPERPQTYWPTAPAALAWSGSGAFAGARDKAVGFLLEAQGEHWARDSNAGAGHDTALRGWPWVDGTHSWVEPTSLALLALRMAGKSDHARYVEGFNMLLDRQLPSGGWNYGNTIGFGQELRPMVDATGLALTAVAGATSRDDVEASVAYLEGRIESVLAPFSLAWALLGLTAWGARPANADERLTASLQRQTVTGEYATSALALALLAHSDQPSWRREGA